MGARGHMMKGESFKSGSFFPDGSCLCQVEKEANQDRVFGPFTSLILHSV